ncbi:MAG: hypothetical protein IH949_10055, partial [Bacteroidetes bacterium]|nr:hypothetical protein [Bacteroidota bacterium]
MDSIIQKLVKRKILRTLAIYLGSSWVIIEASDRFIEKYQWPAFVGDIILTFLVFGLLPTMIYMFKVYRVGDETLAPVKSNNSEELDGDLNSIAVLPFVNMSNDPDQQYFADGMQDALIGELSQISALRVISRTSTLRY